MTLLGDSDVVVLGTAALSLTSTIALAVIGYFTIRMKGQQDIAAKKVDAAAVLVADVAVKTGEVAKKAKEAAEKVAEVAVATEEVKTVLAESTVNVDMKLDGIAKVGETALKIGEANHVLLNNNMHLALADTFVARSAEARLARRLANMRDSLPEDEAVAIEAETKAKEAETALHRHDEKQRVVDAVVAKDARDARDAKP